MEISARFADADDTDKLKKDNFLTFPTELGEVLISRIPSHMDNVVTLRLSRFFKQVIVKGIHAM